MSETLEEKARKIGNDIADVWAILQSNGAMLPHKLNTENLQDVVTQFTPIDKWSSKGLFLYNYDGDYYDFYTKHEVMEMTELPSAPEDSEGWPLTLEQVKTSMESSQSYIVMVAEGAITAETIVNFNFTDSSKLTPTLQFYAENLDGAIIVNWGDGNSDVVTQNGWATLSHTYQGIGEYNVVIQLDDNATITFGEKTGKTGSNASILGSSFSNYRKFIIGATIGNRTKLNNYAFSPSTYAQGYSENYLTGVSSISLPNTMTELNNGCFIFSNFGHFPFASAPITKFGTNCFAGSNFSQTFSLPDGANIGSMAFKFCKINTDVLDLSKVSYVGDNAFEGIKSPGGGHIRSVILPDSPAVFGSSCLAVAGVETVDIPNTWSYVPMGLFKGSTLKSDSVLSDITVPSSVKEIKSSAFESYNGDGSNVILNEGLEIFSGFSWCSNSGGSYCSDVLTINLPSTVHTIGSYAFRHRRISGITFSPNISSVEYSAFQHARIEANELVVPPTVTSVSPQEAFYGVICKKIVFNPSISTLENRMCRSGAADEVVYGNNITTFRDESNEGCVSFWRGFPAGGASGDIDSRRPCNKIVVQGNNVYLGRNCFNTSCVRNIIFENNVSTIEGRKTFNVISSQFQSSYQDFVYNIDFTHCTAVPAITNPNGPTASEATFYVNTTRNIVPKIIVPDNLYSQWIAATGWSNYAQYIVKESEA